jgi:hypothetical protein
VKGETHTLLPKSVMFYDGPSLLDGSRILGIASSKTSNPKTGPMVQTWILKAEVDPWTTVKTNADASICGSCRHRGSETGAGRTCYVTVWQAPLGVWKAREKAERLSPEALGRLIGERNVAVRLGAYGDPAAIPTDVWASLVSGAASWTGYTHQWRTCDQRLSEFCMASVDSPAEAGEAHERGWRTFRVRGAGQPLGGNEIICPASDEAGNRVVCADCRLCQGTAKPAKSIAIIVHGALKGNFDASH